MILEEIKKNKEYRGQIYKGFKFEHKAESTFDLKKISEINTNLCSILIDLIDVMDIESLFQHQGELICNLFKNKSSGIFTPFGSGKKTVLALSAAAYSLYTGGTTLIICENLNKAEKLEEQFNSALKNIVNISGIDTESFSIDISTDIIISSDDKLKELLFANYERVESWLSTLGLIIIDDITSFNSLKIAHLRGLINLFDLISGKNQDLIYLLSGDPISNPTELLVDITGNQNSDTFVVVNDTQLKNSFDLLYWVSPYIIDKKSGKEIIVRRDFYDELDLLISMFEKREKLLVWHLFESISSDRLTNILSSIDSNLEIKIISSLKDISDNDIRTFDSAILVGIPKDLKILPQVLGNILKENSIVSILLPNDPFSHFFIRSDKNFTDFTLPEMILSSENIFINCYYFQLYLLLSKISKINKDVLSKIKIFEILNIISTLIKEEIFVDESDYYSIDKEKLFSAFKPEFFNSISEKVIPVKISNDIIYLDGAYFPEKYFNGAIHFFNEVPFQLTKTEESCEFNPFGDLAPILRVPVMDFKIQNISSKKSLHGTFELSNFQGDLNIDFKGFKEYESYTQRAKDAEYLIFDKPIQFVKHTQLIEIKVGSTTHEFFHLFKIWMPYFFRNFNDLFGMFYSEDRIVIYSFFPNNDGIKSFLLILSTVIKKIMIMSKDLLVFSCPCTTGCPYCLEVIDCYSEKKELNKRETIDNISEKLNISLKDYIELKYKGLGYKAAQPFYEEISEKVFKVFEQKLELNIKNKATLIAVRAKDMKDGVIGLFSGTSVQIIENLNEAKATDAIAHEYAHNWDAENGGRSYDFPEEIRGDKDVEEILSKLISEGFAQWASFKVLDFYGLTNLMAGLYFWGFDEYGEGFRVVYWVEDTFGFQRTLDFIKTGKFKDEDGKEWGLKDILEKSGFKARVLQYLNDKKNN